MRDSVQLLHTAGFPPELYSGQNRSSKTTKQTFLSISLDTHCPVLLSSSPTSMQCHARHAGQGTEDTRQLHIPWKTFVPANSLACSAEQGGPRAFSSQQDPALPAAPPKQKHKRRGRLEAQSICWHSPHLQGRPGADSGPHCGKKQPLIPNGTLSTAELPPCQFSIHAKYCL